MVESENNWWIKQLLKKSSRVNYDKIIHDANLTVTQKQILSMFIVDRLPVYEIALQLSFCESLIRKRIAESYDKIAFS